MIKDFAPEGSSISSRDNCKSSGNVSFIWNRIFPAAIYWPRLLAESNAKFIRSISVSNSFKDMNYVLIIDTKRLGNNKILKN